MRIFVKYNKAGDILSVTNVDNLPSDIDHPYGAMNEDELVMEVSASEEFLRLDVLQIHELYRIDVKKKKLVKK